MHADFDESVLEDLPPHDTIKTCGETPKMKVIKMLKNLLSDALDFLCKSIQEFWSNPNTDFDTWHITSLNILYKGKETPKTSITSEEYVLRSLLPKS
jgi:hypothetical protein